MIILTSKLIVSNVPFLDVSVLGRLTAMTCAGYLDSAIDLGINAAVQDRIVYRKTTDCAVLNTRDRVKNEMKPYSTGSAFPYNNVTYFFYGEQKGDGKNYTWAMSNYTVHVYNFWYDLRYVRSSDISIRFSNSSLPNVAKYDFLAIENVQSDSGVSSRRC